MAPMRRLLRWLLNFACGVSLALLVVTATAWFRSLSGGEALERVEPSWRVVVLSDRGWLQLRRWDGAFPPPGPTQVPPAPGRWTHWQPAPYALWQSGTGWWADRGFGWGDVNVRPSPNAISLHDWLGTGWTGRRRGLSLPYWALAALFSATPLAHWVLPVFGRRRVPRGQGLPVGETTMAGFPKGD